jgi:hypothetical protein
MSVAREVRVLVALTRNMPIASENLNALRAEWLHVDCEEVLEPFYRGCGFRPTPAGLLYLLWEGA